MASEEEIISAEEEGEEEEGTGAILEDDLPPTSPSPSALSNSSEIIFVKNSNFDHSSDKASLVLSEKILRSAKVAAEVASTTTSTKAMAASSHASLSSSSKNPPLPSSSQQKTKKLGLSKLNRILNSTQSASNADIGDLEQSHASNVGHEEVEAKAKKEVEKKVEGVKTTKAKNRLSNVEPFRRRSPSSAASSDGIKSAKPSFMARHRSLDNDADSSSTDDSANDYHSDAHVEEVVESEMEEMEMEMEMEGGEEQTFRELWSEIRPQCRLEFFCPRNNKHMCRKVSKYYGLLWLKILCVIVIMTGVVVGLSMITFSRPTDGRYYDKWAVVSLYSMMAVSTIGFSYGFWVLLYGFKKTLLLLIFVIPALLLSSSWYYILVANGIEPWWYGVEVFMYIIFVGLVAVSCVIMQRAVRQEGDKFLVLVGVPILVKILIWILYSYGVFPLFRSLSDSFYKSLIRIFLHPILMFVNQLICMVFVRAFQNTTPYLATGLVVASYVENTVFGRLMIVALDDEFIVTFYTSLLVGLVELVFRMTFTRRIKLVDWVWRKICCAKCTKNTLDVELEMELQAACMHYEMTIDNAGIVVITILTWMFWTHRTVFNLAYTAFTVTSLGKATLIGGIQLFVNVWIDVIALLIENIQGIPSSRIIREEPYRIFAWTVLCFIQGILLVLYVNRALPYVGFCTSFDPCTCTYGHDLRLFSNCANSTIVANITG